MFTHPRSAWQEWKSERKKRRFCFDRPQNFLKKAGPKPSGPGLALEFMPRRARRTSEASKGDIKDVAWEESRAEEEKRERRSKVREEGDVDPSNCV